MADKARNDRLIVGAASAGTVSQAAWGSVFWWIWSTAT